MALKVKAVERKIKFSKDENDPGVYRYVMSPELYIALSQAKVIREAATTRRAAAALTLAATRAVVARPFQAKETDLKVKG